MRVPVLADVLRWRSALIRLAFKELKVRYKSSMLGVLWAFVVPLATSLVLAVVFGRLIPSSSDRVPYFLFLIAAIFPWNCFHATMTAATTSIQDNGYLVRKSNFPRALVPCSIVLANLLNFLPAQAVVCGVAWAWGLASPELWLLPCAIALLGGLSLGLALLLSALQVSYRDTKYLVDVGLVLWFYLTPIIYPPAAVAPLEGWARAAILANPMAGIVSLCRAALLGWEAAGIPAGVGPAQLLLWTGLAAAAMAWAGAWLFSRRASTMADLVQ